MSIELRYKLKERLHTRRLDKFLVASMSSSTCHCYSIDYDQNIFVKTSESPNARVMFDGELESLKQIGATKTIRVPKPITVMHNFDNNGSSALVMEYLNIVRLSRDGGESLGKNLADLHDYNNKVIRANKRASGWVGRQVPSVKHLTESSGARGEESTEYSEDHEDGHEEENQFARHRLRAEASGKTDSKPSECSDRFVPEPDTKEVNEFGFDVPTSCGTICGTIPQSNTWSQNWVTFYAQQRLDHTIRMILSDHGDRELNEEWSHLQNKLDKFFSDFEHKATRKGEIIPALLHGDLWSGNVAQLSDGSCGVCYDPASFYGHSEYEFGIVRMFRSFPESFEAAYFKNMPKMKLFEKRNKLYQLFHYLNLWNQIGSCFRMGSLGTMKSLNREALEI